MGIAVHYARSIDMQFGERLFKELNIPIEDYEAVCDPIDLPDIRRAANGE